VPPLPVRCAPRRPRPAGRRERVPSAATTERPERSTSQACALSSPVRPAGGREQDQPAGAHGRSRRQPLSSAADLDSPPLSSATTPRRSSRCRSAGSPRCPSTWRCGEQVAGLAGLDRRGRVAVRRELGGDPLNSSWSLNQRSRYSGPATLAAAGRPGRGSGPAGRRCS
jgi:hypothetical protein